MSRRDEDGEVERGRGGGIWTGRRDLDGEAGRAAPLRQGQGMVVGPDLCALDWAMLVTRGYISEGGSILLYVIAVFWHFYVCCSFCVGDVA
jgi:hypothetical protein